jgi:hypothetical protein
MLLTDCPATLIYDRLVAEDRSLEILYVDEILKVNMDNVDA